MISNKELKEYLLKNRVDKYGDMDLSDLDLRDFDGDVFIDRMKVKNNLYQNSQTVGRNLYQSSQQVGEGLCQNNQNVKGDYYCYKNKAKGEIEEDPCEKWVETHTIVIDGKEIEISEESYKALKESLEG